MNVTNLILQLKSKITSDSFDQQAISKAIKLLQLGAVDYVSSTASLPAASTNAGRLYYVEADGLYFSTNGQWVPIAQNTINYIFGFGNNTGGLDAGFLGDGTIINRSSPVSVIGCVTNWTQVSGKNGVTFGLERKNPNIGILWSWGNGAFGGLGNNGTANRSSPGTVVGGFTDWCRVAAGSNFGLGLRSNGTLWAWGSGSVGQLGDLNVVNRSSPVTVVGGFSDWCQVSAFCDHSAAIRTNGTLWSWGRNQCGRLGDGTTIYRSSPVSAVGGFTDWCCVSAGQNGTAALRTNGTAWVWGAGAGGLGNNDTISQSSPVSVVGGFTDWTQIASGQQFVVGLRANGTLWGWGNNLCGRIGDGTEINRSSPVTVVGGFTDWCCVSAGDERTLALRTNNTIWSWGFNTEGRLGDGTTINRSSPVSVIAGSFTWVSAEAGYRRNFLIGRKDL